MILKTALLLSLVLVIVFQMHDYSRLIVPTEHRVEADDIEEALLSLGAPERKVEQLAEALRNASRATNLSTKLLAALVYTESTFNNDAVSKRGYKGLMQIPQDIPYPDANILVGARILEDKLRLADGDLNVALAMYKGGRDKAQAQRYAAYTIRLYNRLKSKKGGEANDDEG